MLNHEETLQTLLRSERITKNSVAKAPRQQGVYVLWLDSDPQVCLKTGMAGPRQGKGLWERLRFHYSSNPGNTVLAKHMAADCSSEWRRDWDFQDREQRKEFLATRCFFQALALPGLSRPELKRVEMFLENRLNPRYVGRVRR
jgi:hypothetical protein